MSNDKKYWHLEGEELEEHLANDCSLSIIEPMQTTEYFTQDERELLAQFPRDQPEVPEYDGVYKLDPSMTKMQAMTIFVSMLRADDSEAVGDIFKTARFWCLRVKYCG